MILADLQLSTKSRRTPESAINHFMEVAIANPQLISLAAGMVDTASLPVGPVAEALEAILADPTTGQAALQYGTTQGHPKLREWIVEHVATMDGIRPTDNRTAAKNVVVLTGSQQFLYMIGEVLLDPGDIVLVEAPTYFVFQTVLQGNGVRIVSIPMDDQGLRTDALVQTLAELDHQGELHRVKLLYTVDYSQNPTGLTLSLERRHELMRIVRGYADRQRILILEDAAYRELRYDGDDIPSLKSLDTENAHVVYAGTFSKPCAPGMKTGYAILPDALVEPIVRFKSNHDFGSNNLSQHLLHRLTASGAYARHVEYLRMVYRAKRDAMVEALASEFSNLPGAAWTRPIGGMFVWLTLPEGINTGPNGVLIQAVLREGVLYIPGEFGFMPDADYCPTNGMRLSFGASTIEQIREGIRRLRRAVESVRESAASPKRKPAFV